MNEPELILNTTMNLTWATRLKLLVLGAVQIRVEQTHENYGCVKVKYRLTPAKRRDENRFQYDRVSEKEPTSKS